MSCYFCDGGKLFSATEDNILTIDSNTISIDTKLERKRYTNVDSYIETYYKNDYFYINFCPICGDEIDKPKKNSVKSFINENVFVYFKEKSDVCKFLCFCEENNILWYWSDKSATNIDFVTMQKLETKKYLIYANNCGKLQFCSPKYAKERFKNYKFLNSKNFTADD